jgi:hypothetical protein
MSEESKCNRAKEGKEIELGATQEGVNEEAKV